MLTLNWSFVNNWSFTYWDVRSTLRGWSGGHEIIESLPCSLYPEDQLFFLPLPQSPLLICTLFQLTSCLIFHLDHKLIHINFFDVAWALSLIYVLKYVKAGRLVLGRIPSWRYTPCPSLLESSFIWFSLNDDEPWKSACFWPCIEQELGTEDLSP